MALNIGIGTIVSVVTFDGHLDGVTLGEVISARCVDFTTDETEFVVEYENANGWLRTDTFRQADVTRYTFPETAGRYDFLPL